MLTKTLRDDIICLNRVSYRYPDGNLALRELDLRIKRGEKVALVGPNGAGKSTLLLHLNGVLGALDGSVRVGDLDVRRETLPQVRALVGLVFQDPDDQLFSPTVFDDVAFGPLHMGLPEAQVRQRVQWALEQVGMQGFDDRMPHHMSVGQRKRVSIATVLSMEPAILALDEPSAGLDPRARRSLIQLLAALPQTLLVSTHDMPMVAEVFERTIVLCDGVVVHDGPTTQILNDRALLQQYGLEMS
ncbi:MAG: ATPase component NikO of energizing module of nickel ECF transporter [uncultured Chloroflexia bacterium]|uniref:ATPase component NikO of energizing module of nickel ECF transporter n=1 Tax=uncultured Chloroflexia bacterium TaxID=1672391 RepID=A0A6J4IT73_9CHLR|nr:MAG: ATPase component NikO of energizing module of nickel ECF transporter [uncultured Chloroflexia bacterium]